MKASGFLPVKGSKFFTVSMPIYRLTTVHHERATNYPKQSDPLPMADFGRRFLGSGVSPSNNSSSATTLMGCWTVFGELVWLRARLSLQLGPA